jgi:hypothetical protein
MSWALLTLISLREGMSYVRSASRHIGEVWTVTSMSDHDTRMGPMDEHDVLAERFEARRARLRAELGCHHDAIQRDGAFAKWRF